MTTNKFATFHSRSVGRPGRLLKFVGAILLAVTLTWAGLSALAGTATGVRPSEVDLSATASGAPREASDTLRPMYVAGPREVEKALARLAQDGSECILAGLSPHEGVAVVVAWNDCGSYAQTLPATSTIIDLTGTEPGDQDIAGAERDYSQEAATPAYYLVQGVEDGASLALRLWDLDLESVILVTVRPALAGGNNDDYPPIYYVVDSEVRAAALRTALLQEDQESSGIGNPRERVVLVIPSLAEQINVPPGATVVDLRSGCTHIC